MNLEDIDRIEALRVEALSSTGYTGVAMCLKLTDEELPKVLSALRSAIVLIGVYEKAASPVTGNQQEDAFYEKVEKKNL